MYFLDRTFSSDFWDKTLKWYNLQVLANATNGEME